MLGSVAGTENSGPPPPATEGADGKDGRGAATAEDYLLVAVKAQ